MGFSANPLNIDGASLNFLSKPLIMDVHMFELCFEFGSFSCDKAYGLLIVAVENVWAIRIKPKILKESPPPDEFSTG